MAQCSMLQPIIMSTHCTKLRYGWRNLARNQFHNLMQSRCIILEWLGLKLKVTNYKADFWALYYSDLVDRWNILYFWCLIYRNEKCNWRLVVNNLGQVVGCIFYTHFLFVRFCVPIFRKFGQEEFTGVSYWNFLNLYHRFWNKILNNHN